MGEKHSRLGTPRDLAFTNLNQIARRERRWIPPPKAQGVVAPLACPPLAYPPTTTAAAAAAKVCEKKHHHHHHHHRRKSTYYSLPRCKPTPNRPPPPRYRKSLTINLRSRTGRSL